MATPKIDQIAIEFIELIGDKFTTTFTGGSAMPGSRILTAAQIMSFINRAMLKLFEDVWFKVGGDKRKFIKIFPELHKVAEAVDLNYTSGITSYTVASPYLDMHTLIGGRNTLTGTLIAAWDSSLYDIYVTEDNHAYTGTTDRIGMTFMKNQGKIFAFPNDINKPPVVLRTLTVTGTADSSPLIEVSTSSAHGLSPGDTVYIYDIVGTTELNNTEYSVQTVPNTTTFTVTETYVNAYVSGGSVDVRGDLPIDIMYLAQPTNPGTGGLLTQNGTYDCPFGYEWINKLAEMAAAIFKVAAQESS